jgi:hypothetical protein
LATDDARTALNQTRSKVYLRILPLLFVCDVIVSVVRANVSVAALPMVKGLPRFDNSVIGFGAGLFFLSYIRVNSSLRQSGLMLDERDPVTYPPECRHSAARFTSPTISNAMRSRATENRRWSR